MSSPLEQVIIEAPDTEAPTQDEIDEMPWKYTGYKGLTSFMSSDSDFFAIRRFDRLHTRALLTLQSQLVELEGRLDSMDKKYSSKYVKAAGRKGPPQIVDLRMHRNVESMKESLRDINNGTVRDDLHERKDLVAEIIAKLESYDKTLLNYSSLHSLTPAPSRNVRNIDSWFDANPGAITQTETQFVCHHDELVSVCRPGKSSMRHWFEDHIVFRTRKTLKLFSKMRTSTPDNKVFEIRDQAIDATASVVAFAFAAAMLILPLWILQTLQAMQWKLVVISTFVLLCLAFLTVATLGRPFERLATTAG